MISVEDAEKAIDYLRDSALKTARARAEYGYLDAYTKVVKATIMRDHQGESLGAQEAIAFADSRYKQHLDAVKTACEAFEYLRFMREAADAKFRAYQTQEATERSGRP